MFKIADAAKEAEKVLAHDALETEDDEDDVGVSDGFNGNFIDDDFGLSSIRKESEQIKQQQLLIEQEVKIRMRKTVENDSSTSFLFRSRASRERSIKDHQQQQQQPPCRASLLRRIRRHLRSLSRRHLRRPDSSSPDRRRPSRLSTSRHQEKRS